MLKKINIIFLFFIFFFVFIAIILFLLVNISIFSKPKSSQIIKPSKKDLSNPKNPIDINTFKPKIPPGTNMQEWYLDLSAIISHRNGENLNTLITGTIQDAKNLLYDSWGVINQRSAYEILDWLKYTGHSQQFKEVLEKILKAVPNSNEELFYLKRKQIADTLTEAGDETSRFFIVDFVWKHRVDLEKKQLLAWDYVRMINVARWSYSAGYITEKEAWEYITYGGIRLQKYYDSWKEIGEHYLLGRTFWRHNAYHYDIESSINWLLTNPQSPWLKIPWNTKLE